MKALLFSNPGKFSKGLVEFLSDNGIDVHFSYNYKSVNFDFNDYDVVIFTGGETRKEEVMEDFNFEYPSHIVDKCIKLNKRFVYLSTLSVFGYPDTDVVSIGSRRSPFNLYGETKNKFDEYVAKVAEENNYFNYTAIYPASFKSSNGRSSVERIEKIFNKFPFLKLFSFSGFMTYVSVFDVYKQVLISINDEEGSDSYVLMADEFHLKDLSYKFSIKLPTVPAFLIRIIPVKKKIKYAIRCVLRGVAYK